MPQRTKIDERRERLGEIRAHAGQVLAALDALEPATAVNRETMRNARLHASACMRAAALLCVFQAMADTCFSGSRTAFQTIADTVSG